MFLTISEKRGWRNSMKKWELSMKKKGNDWWRMISRREKHGENNEWKLFSVISRILVYLKISLNLYGRTDEQTVKPFFFSSYFWGVKNVIFNYIKWPLKFTKMTWTSESSYNGSNGPWSFYTLTEFWNDYGLIRFDYNKLMVSITQKIC